MRGDEARVEQAFVLWLRAQGWDVRVQVDHADVVAVRDGMRLVAEAKGRTTDPGTDLDTLYGQLLRRMSDDPEYGVVVPEGRALRAALRVGADIREALRITIFVVADDGQIVKH